MGSSTIGKKSSKRKNVALTRLRKAGKAWDYVNSTWRFRIVGILCTKKEVSGVIEENSSGE